MNPLTDSTFKVESWHVRTGFHCVKTSLSVALVIIGLIGAAGWMSSGLLAGSAVGLSISTALASCCGGGINAVAWSDESLKTDDFDAAANCCWDTSLVVYNVVIAALGALVMYGAASATTLSWFIITPVVVPSIVMGCCVNSVLCTWGNLVLVDQRFLPKGVTTDDLQDVISRVSSSPPEVARQLPHYPDQSYGVIGDGTPGGGSDYGFQRGRSASESDLLSSRIINLNFELVEHPGLATPEDGAGVQGSVTPQAVPSPFNEK